MKIKILYGILLVIMMACGRENDDGNATETNFISAVDISDFPEMALQNPVFYNAEGQQPTDVLQLLKDKGVNTIRLRLWVNPGGEHSGLQEVMQFSQQLKATGFRIWITAHYSDTWADPGHQETPQQWQGIPYLALQDSVRQYTQNIMERIAPDYFQIGNEINPGMLHPAGDRFLHPDQFNGLLTVASEAVRTHAPDTKIMIHYAGLSGAVTFFDQIDGVDYDMIGLSFYPIWHGKDMEALKNTLQELGETFQKDLVIAETAYPFTLGWNDWTNNIVGQEDQLILPEFPATPQGQKDFIAAVKAIITEDVTAGLGFCYWGAASVAWKGPQATDASPWENQALFDFTNTALPVLEEFELK